MLKAVKEMKLILVKQAWHPPSILQDIGIYQLNKSSQLVLFAFTELCRQGTWMCWWMALSTTWIWMWHFGVSLVSLFCVFSCWASPAACIAYAVLGTAGLADWWQGEHVCVWHDVGVFRRIMQQSQQWEERSCLLVPGASQRSDHLYGAFTHREKTAFGA